MAGKEAKAHGGEPLEPNTPLRQGARVSLLDGLVVVYFENDGSGMGYRVENKSDMIVEVDIGSKGNPQRATAASNRKNETKAAKLPNSIKDVTENDMQITVNVYPRPGVN